MFCKRDLKLRCEEKEEKRKKMFLEEYKVMRWAWIVWIAVMRDEERRIFFESGFNINEQINYKN